MYLMRKKGFGAHAAVQHCRARRGCVEPNPGFAEALRMYADQLGIKAGGY